MRAERRGPRGRCRRGPHHRFGVAGRFGVMGEPGEVGAHRRRESRERERPPVQREPAMRAPADSSTARRASSCRKATPRASPTSMPGGDAFVEAADDVAGERLEQPELGMLRNDRGRFEQSPRRGSSRRRGRARRRAPSAGLLVAGRERLGDEERVAAGLAVELAGVDAVRLGEARDGRRARAGRAEAGCTARRSRARRARCAQRVSAAELVVAVAGEHERRDGVDPAAEEPQDVERGARRPSGRPRARGSSAASRELTHQCPGDLVGAAPPRRAPRARRRSPPRRRAAARAAAA